MVHYRNSSHPCPHAWYERLGDGYGSCYCKLKGKGRSQFCDFASKPLWWKRILFVKEDIIDVKGAETCPLMLTTSCNLNVLDELLPNVL